MDYRYKLEEVTLAIERQAKKMNDEIMDRLIAYRKQLHMTQQDVADATGIARPNIARMERKKYMSSVDNLIKYAKCLGKELRFEMYDASMVSRPMPVGVAEFRKVSKEFCYVDKTLLIKEVIDAGNGVTLFARPRRFGKSLNMDMLRVFFEKTEKDTGQYFTDKKIWACGEDYLKHQAQYPVIFLSFKDVKFKTWEEAFSYLKWLLSVEFCRHKELFDSSKCNVVEKRYFEKVVAMDVSVVELTMALMMLTKMLDLHHDRAPVIIIDEYDTPIQQGYMNGYYEEVIAFMRNFFSGGLKDNQHLSYGFLTGILHIAKESIFSSLNNIKVNTILDEKYSQYFGFTTEEVRQLAEARKVPEKYGEICNWYDGYLFGQEEIFNPWSVICYFDAQCQAKNYWVSTSNNDIIGEILENEADEIREDLQVLLCGGAVNAMIDPGVVYPSIKKNASSVYSFLLMAGYLKLKAPMQWGVNCCNGEVMLPNREIKDVFRKEILSKLTAVISNSTIDLISEAIRNKDAQTLQEKLRELLLHIVSYHDVANEGFYHGFILGLCVLMNGEYYITSNRESGDGRYDIQLVPHGKELPGILIEVKAAKNCTDVMLEQLAHDALEQIRVKKYDSDMQAKGIREVYKYGVAFCGKKVKIAQQC